MLICIGMISMPEASTLPFIEVLVFSLGIDVDEFVEASSQLVQPLEDFFNEVFVMVVRFFIILLNEKAHLFLIMHFFSQKKLGFMECWWITLGSQT